MVAGKDNSLLVEFEFVVDMDLAIFKYIRNNYFDSDYVRKDFLSLKDEREIIINLISRKHINVLEYLIPDMDTKNMYYELMNDREEELLKYAKAYDTFALMVTFLKEASSVSIDILCKNQLEADFIKGLNPMMSTIIGTRKEVPLEYYTAIYTKYFSYLALYDRIAKKHIYLPYAKYNMEENKNTLNIRLSALFGDVNEIRLIDMYRYVKYRLPKSEEV